MHMVKSYREPSLSVNMGALEELWPWDGGLYFGQYSFDKPKHKVQVLVPIVNFLQLLIATVYALYGSCDLIL